MFANFATIVSVLATFVAVAPSAYAAPSTGLAGRSQHNHRAVPAQFREEKRNYTQDEEYLEPYVDYHERYNLFDCASKHNTSFWDSCCHPLHKNQTEDVLPDVCFEDLPCDSTTTTTHHHSTTHVHATSTIVDPITSTVKAETTTTHKAETTTKATTTKAPHTTTKTTHTVEPTTSTVSSGGSWRTGGFATYFYQEGNYGACGKKHSDEDLIVAIDVHYYGDLDKTSPTCGDKLDIVNMKNGKTVTATVADVCPTCNNGNSLDMSLGTFHALGGTASEGMFEIKYKVVGKN